MAITDLQISEELMTNAPSIKYRGDEGPKSPEEEMKMVDALLEEEYEKYIYDLLEQRPDATPMSLEEFKRMVIGEGMMSRGPVLPSDEDPINPFGPKPIGPPLPDRKMAAYGGIMGLDGRRQYGIGSWFQENIMDPIKKNPLVTAAIAAAGYDLFGRENSTIKSILNKPIFEDILKGKEVTDKKTGEVTRQGGLYDAISSNIVPIVSGLGAGLFTKKTQDQNTTPGTPNDQTAMQLADLKKSANILDQKQGLAAGLNFLVDDASRKFSPTEMVEAYSQTAANGGRIGFNMGGGANMGAPQMTRAEAQQEAITKIMQKMQDPNLTNEDRAFLQAKLQGFMSQQEMPMMSNDGMANGGRIGFTDGGKDYSQDANYKGWLKLYETNPDAAEMSENHTEYLAFYNRNNNSKAEGGIMDLGGLEKDYRAEGGFVPIGKREKADDVPARLSVNEFVFTADAVRNAGGGDVDEGAKVMERVMKHLEGGGQMSRESQGMGGAREMFETSERLSEVV